MALMNYSCVTEGSGKSLGDDHDPLLSYMTLGYSSSLCFPSHQFVDDTNSICLHLVRLFFFDDTEGFGHLGFQTC